MKVGNKVRFLHSKGEGIVRKIIDTKTVDVEIEDGFIVPFLKSDLVVISTDESFISGTSSSATQSLPSESKGNIWFAFVPFNDKLFSIYLINDSSEDILYTFNQNKEGINQGLSNGILKSGTHTKIGEALVAEFEEWPEWIIQLLFYRDGITSIKTPISKHFKLKANTFFKNKQNVPLLQKEGHAFKVDDGIKVNSTQIAESMQKGNDITTKVQRPASEIDLHIEKLVPNHSQMSNSEILRIQLQHFENNLDSALASGMEEIVFIHGVGNGVLRQELHKLLSKNKNIRFFQDARKEKFGYGATLVRIK